MTPYWEGGGVTLYHGDAIEVLATFKGQSIDHVLTDPPFEAEAHTKGRRMLQRLVDDKDRGPASTPLDFAPITEELRQASAFQFARLARRWALVFCQIEAADLWRATLGDAGLKYKRTCIWVKPDGTPNFTGDGPGMGYETFVAYHADGNGRSTWNGGGRRGVFYHNKHIDDDDKTGHQTQKPLALMSELVTLFTDPGDLVCDPFAGSGTTLVAAYQLGRKAVGVELSEPYCEAIAKRMETEISQGRLFESPPIQMTQVDLFGTSSPAVQPNRRPNGQQVKEAQDPDGAPRAQAEGGAA